MRLGSVLVANRGEIAVRIIRTARRLGLRTVAVYSEADRDALHVTMADEAVAVGPAPAAESYLSIERVVAAALAAGARCIHPGYGFLSENPALAEACERAGLVFVGPPAEAMRALGLKDVAKAVAERAGLPVVPGYHGGAQDLGTLAEAAARIGYPVLVKAVAGGGGRGMRRVDHPSELPEALAAARREAEGAFGDPRVLLERWIAAPRHVEVQVLADAHGGAVHLFERDCSLQRRHQKVIEEAPAPGIDAEARAALGRSAVALAQAVGYVGAGTVEFITEAGEALRPDRAYFLEMNTRLQVEHPVTEAITGLDLVEWQFRVAAGEPLAFTQDDLSIQGHAAEARLYAEDPEAEFRPSAGRVWALRLPQGEGLRVETGLREGDAVSPYYDPMIAKVIAHGANRGQALDRLSAALGRTLVAGPRTNLALLRALVDHEEFRAGRFDTGTVEHHIAHHLVGRAGAAGPDPEMVLAGARALLVAERARVPERAPGSPWAVADGFQLGPARVQGAALLVDDQQMDAAVPWPADAPLDIEVVETDRGVLVLRAGRQIAVALDDPFALRADPTTSGGPVRAPMPGRLTALYVTPGDRVERGQLLAVIEAMKMEHRLTAPHRGTVASVAAEPGAQVTEGAALIIVTPETPDE